MLEILCKINLFHDKIKYWLAQVKLTTFLAEAIRGDIIVYITLDFSEKKSEILIFI